jgi:hypothetical protein
MTNPTQPNRNPLPAILVYGTPSGPALTQASWFRAEDKEAVKATSEALKFSVIEWHTDADRALATGTHEGVLKGSGGMIVGSVSAEVYRRIEEHARERTSAAGSSKPENAATVTKPFQNKPRTSARLARSRRTPACEPWRAEADDLKAGRRKRSRGASGRHQGPCCPLERETGIRGLLARHRQANRTQRIHPRMVRESGISVVHEPAPGHRRPSSRVPRHGQVARAKRDRQNHRHSLLMGRPSGRLSSFRAPHEPGAPSQLQPQEIKPMTSRTVTAAERIRTLDDAFRRTFVGGAVVITAGVEAMPVPQRRSLFEKVRAFDAFTDDNDPNGEHDFGSVDEGSVRCFWKIDDYDRNTEFGSPDPTDPAVTTRVLTIMLANAY